MRAPLVRLRRLAAAAVVALAVASPAEAGLDAAVAAYMGGDYAAAVAALKPKAEAGDPTAQYLMGQLTEAGLGVAEDDRAALEWYRKAAEAGFAKAQYHLGLLYETGEAVPRDFARAAAWHRRAAERGFAPAQASLGRLYLAGLGVERDPIQAHLWFSLAEAQEYPGAKRYRMDAARMLNREQLAYAEALADDFRPKTR